MSSTARGPLPAHVYRRRRFAVLTIAVLLVLGFGRVLSWSSDGSEGGEDQATQAAAGTTPTATPGEKKSKKKTNKNKNNKNKDRDKDKTPTPTPTPTPLAAPSGPCPDSEVLVTPSLPDPVGGRDVTILLNFQMQTTEACTWRVSPETMEVKITSGVDVVWWSGECPAAIPTQDVVIRQAVPTPVTMLWSSKRSDEYCTNRTAWALPGAYTAAASALEGEPTHVDFELTAPVAAVVTQTAEPSERSSR